MGKNSSRSDAASFHLHPSGNCQCLSTFSSNSHDLHIFAGKFMSKWCIWEIVFSIANLSLDCKMQPFHWNKSPQEDQTLIKLTACNKLVQQKFSWTISWTIFQLEKEPWFVYFWRNFPIKIKTSWFPQSLLIISHCAF